MNPIASPTVPRWAQTEQRDRVYETLYRGSRFLHLAPALWQLVYADRDSVAQQRRSFYVDGFSERSHLPTEELDWTRHTLGYRLTTGLNDGGGAYRWPPPRFSKAGGRVFEMQDDGHLCATHALNNVARAVLLQPPLMMEAIAARGVALRPSNDFDKYASRQDLFLAALRRGVVLAPLQLTDVIELRMLQSPAELTAAGQHVHVARALCVEQLLYESGGLVLLLPGASGRGGHFVPVVPLSPTRWVVYSMSEIIVEAETVGGAIAALLLRQFAGRHAARSFLELAGDELIGLVPLCVELDATDRSAALTESRALARYWARSVLSNATVSTDRVQGRQVRDIKLISAFITPLELHYICNRLRAASLLSGADARNPFTVYKAQAQLELALNALVDELAQTLIIVDPVTRRSSGLLYRTPHAVPALERATRRASIVVILRRMRSLLREPQSIGLLLGEPWSCDSESDPSLCAPIANRQWLRFVALQSVALLIANHVEHGQLADPAVSLPNWRAIVPRPVTDDTLGRVLVLLCAVAFTDLRTDSDMAARYTYINRLWYAVFNAGLGATLPLLPPSSGWLAHEKAVADRVLQRAAVDTKVGREAAQIWLLGAVRYERALWLLSSTEAAFRGSPALLFDRTLIADLQLPRDRSPDSLAPLADSVASLDFFRRVAMQRPTLSDALDRRRTTTLQASPATETQRLRIAAARQFSAIVHALKPGLGAHLESDVLEPLRRIVVPLAANLTSDAVRRAAEFRALGRPDSALADARATIERASATLTAALNDASSHASAVINELLGAEPALADIGASLVAAIRRALGETRDRSVAAILAVEDDNFAAIARIISEALTAAGDGVAQSFEVASDVTRPLSGTALRLLDIVAFTSLYGRVDSVEDDDVVAVTLRQIVRQIALDNSIKPQLLELLYVDLGADTLRGTLYDIARDAPAAYNIPRAAERNARIVPRARPPALLNAPQSDSYSVLASRAPRLPLSTAVTVAPLLIEEEFVLVGTRRRNRTRHRRRNKQHS